jgi:hypothetical protein
MNGHAEHLERDTAISIAAKSMKTTIKISNLRKKRAWYEAVAMQGDIQATISIHRLTWGEQGYILEGHYGKISVYGKLGQRQIERGSLLLELLEQHVQIALLEAGWNMHADSNGNIWEQAEQPKEGQQP